MLLFHIHSDIFMYLLLKYCFLWAFVLKIITFENVVLGLKYFLILETLFKVTG